MTAIWVIIGLIMWYGLGLLGSTIALTSMQRELGFSWEEEDRRFGYGIAILGFLNFAVALFCAFEWKQGIHLDWGWARGSIKR